MRLRNALTAFSSLFSPAARGNANETHVTAELHRSFADVSLSEDDNGGDGPPRKRLKLEYAPSGPQEPGSKEFMPLIDLATPSDDEVTLAGDDRMLSEAVQTATNHLQIRPSPSNFPRSLCDGWDPPMPPTFERTALDQLLVCLKCPFDKLHANFGDSARERCTENQVFA